MDDLIQILFFILTFALFIFSAIRKQKKPNSQAKPFENVLESLLGIPLVNEPLKNNIEQQQNNNINNIETSVSYTDNQNDNKQEARKEADDEAEEFTKHEVTFDLRSAVIYSEILNRRNY